MSYPKIDLTITTFKRRDLFERTMDSFLDTCLDLNLINRWLVGDDGSSSQDLFLMKSKYPFLIICNNPKQGQASNVNNLFSKVGTEWFFHMEDDWLFVKRDNYIQKLFDIVFEDELIRNATLRLWKGENSQKTKTGVDYFVHDFLPLSRYQIKNMTEEERRKVNQADAMWCGYTLNPSLQHKATVDRLGKYDENFDIKKRSWDRQNAIKYYEIGFKRANLLDKYIEHIGEENSAYNIRK